VQIHGFDQAAAVFIAAAIDMHDKQTTERRFRRKLQNWLMEELDNEDRTATLRRARTIRKSCEQRGIYTRTKSAGRANPADFRINRQTSHMPWRTTT
jgi:hypothetical protein